MFRDVFDRPRTNGEIRKEIDEGIDGEGGTLDERSVLDVSPEPVEV